MCAPDLAASSARPIMRVPKKLYDFIVVGTGPAAASWVRTALTKQPKAQILMVERGPYCKTDLLTEKNPFKCVPFRLASRRDPRLRRSHVGLLLIAPTRRLLRASKAMIKNHNHEVAALPTPPLSFRRLLSHDPRTAALLL